MIGWRIVPVTDVTAEQVQAMCAVTCSDETGGCYGDCNIGPYAEQFRKGVAAAPEPDWEALAGIVLNDDVYDQYATGGEIRRLAAALRATFGSKP